MKTKRTLKDKLNTLLFGKDLRVTTGEPFTTVRYGDYSSYFPLNDYIDFTQSVPDTPYNIKKYGADERQISRKIPRPYRRQLMNVRLTVAVRLLLKAAFIRFQLFIFALMLLFL